MTPQARFIHEGRAIDYIPSSEVSAGSVQVLGSIVGVAPVTIPAGALGSLATAGVFDVVKGSAAFQLGAPVYWSGSEAAASGTFIGFAVRAAADSDGFVRVMLSTPGAPA